jgi:hypothetical protein
MARCGEDHAYSHVVSLGLLLAPRSPGWGDWATLGGARRLPRKTRGSEGSMVGPEPGEERDRVGVLL